MSVKYYRDLLRQRTRIERFREAIQRVVRPGDRVLEVGAGLGTFAFFAADAGAARVWGIDGHPVIHVAQAISDVNGYGDRVEFIRGWIPHVEIAERADVLIFEDFPSRLVDGRIFQLYRDAVARYLRTPSRAVPCAARCCLAPVSGDVAYREVAPFGADDRAYDIAWAPSRSYLENTPLAVTIRPDEVLGPHAEGRPLRLDDVPDTRRLVAEGEWTFERDTPVHGLVYWFDLELAPGLWLSNAPGADPGSWGHLFLAAAPPVTVERGEVLTARAGPELAENGAPAWFTWELSAGGETRRGHEFAAEPAALGDLLVGSPDAVPALGANAQIEANVLQLTDGVRTVRDIAGALCAHYPGMAPGDAERYVAVVLRGRATAHVPDRPSMEVTAS